ncbi:MAG: metal ABC transporter permease, partial [Burkholderiales bacterium]
MRSLATTPPATSPTSPQERSDWLTLKRLLPYLLEYKWRVAAALAFMVAAKVANVGVPVLLKELVDAMTLKPSSVQSMLVIPM